MDSKWLEWARALQAISQTGLHYAKDPFDRQRYEQIARVAAEMVASGSNLSTERMLQYAAAEFGYATPKVDVRGVAFRDSKILLVREIQDHGRWTVPGGWADVNETPSEAVVREVFEESGFETRAIKLLALCDREKRGHVPPFPYHVYKLFFLCEIVGGTPRPNQEASEIAFFGEHELPELSVSRVTEAEIRMFFRRLRHPTDATDFD
jgi:ADP-ribose pyrophosphatase YjhB (NUDIX family)